MSSTFPISLAPRSSVVFLGIGIILIASLITLGTAFVIPDFWLQLLVLLIGGIVFLPFFLTAPEHWLFSLLVLSLSFAARLRLFGSQIHQGGAEGALAPLDFPLLALAGLYLLDNLKHKSWKWGRVEFALALWGMLMLPSLFVAPNVSFSIYELIRLGKVLLLIACIRRFICTPQRAVFVVYLLLAVILLQSTLGLMQFALNRSLGLFALGEADSVFLDTSIGEGSSRVGGTLGHANNLALFLELLLPFCFSIFLSTDIRVRLRTLTVIVLALGTVTIVLTQSRSGWLAFVVALTIVLLSQVRNRYFWTNGKLLTLGAVVLAAIVSLWLLWDKIYLRLTASSPYSFLFRRNLLTIAWQMVQDSPLIGTGLNNFVLNVPHYLTANIINQGYPVHNIYFLIAAETGMFGFVGFVIVLFAIFRTGRQAVRQHGGVLAAMARGLLAGIVAVLTHGLLGWGWRLDVVNILFWFIVGYLISLNAMQPTALGSGDQTAVNPHIA
ncbi:MAG: O-antigen ligase family protein [Anaerolineales bacterium]|nr:O-antigen ligase family protein [Anaerolineales bacterium]